MYLKFLKIFFLQLFVLRRKVVGYARTNFRQDTTHVTQALQHIIVWSISLIYPVALLNAFPELAKETTLLSITFFCSGLITLFFGKRISFIGTGFFCIQTSSVIFVIPSIEAMHQGGYPLLLGMTICSGIFIVILSRMTRFFQKLFPPEVIGLVMFMLGVSLIFTGTKYVMVTDSGQFPLLSSIFVACITLVVTVLCYVWGGKKIRSLALAVGIVIGTTVGYFLGLVPAMGIETVKSENLFEIPNLFSKSYDFSLELLPIFLIAGLVVFLKNSADLLTASRIIDEKNSRIPFAIIQRGLLTSGLGSIVSALFGNTGQSISSSNIGYAASTKNLDSKISYIIGTTLIIISFFPKIISGFLLIPQAVLGAIIFYLVSFFIMNGMKIIMSRVMDSRKFFVIGLSILVGLIFEVEPSIRLLFPPVLQALFSYSLTITIFVAMFLNLLFRIGIYQKHVLVISFKNDQYVVELINFIDKVSRRFGISVDLHQRVKDALKSFAELIYVYANFYVDKGSLDLVKFYFKYDNIRLKVDIVYKSSGSHSLKKLLDYKSEFENKIKLIGGLEERTILLMTQYQLKQNVDIVRIANPQGLNRVSLYFYY